jgi:hypothetical protein
VADFPTSGVAGAGTAQPEYFAETYDHARHKFLAAARAAGAHLSTHVNAEHALGPAGEKLAVDVAWLGSPSAESVVVLVSGTHGVEGYCGSACQVGFLRENLLAQAPDDTAFLLVHGLNPYGFAHTRRVNEDNVDLNRNFVDHASPPHNGAYGDLHDALVPPQWTGDGRRAADGYLRDAVARRGIRHLQAAVTHGQYAHPDGLFYGGIRPAWSNTVLREIARRHLSACHRVAYIDLHTGLGEWGAGEPIFRGGRDPAALSRARAWYGHQLTVSEDGTSSSTPIIGNTATLIADVLTAGQRLTAITLEFGTLPGPEVLTALRADNWLHLQDHAPAGIFGEIKQQMRAAFYPSEPAWRVAAWQRARQVFGQALAGLAVC